VNAINTDKRKLLSSYELLQRKRLELLNKKRDLLLVKLEISMQEIEVKPEEEDSEMALPWEDD